MSDTTITRTILDEATEAVLEHSWEDFPRSAHGKHNYYGACAVCREDVPAITAVVLLVVEKRCRDAAAATDTGEAVPRRIADPDEPEGRAFLRGYAQSLDDFAAAIAAAMPQDTEETR